MRPPIGLKFSHRRAGRLLSLADRLQAKAKYFRSAQGVAGQGQG